MIAAAAPVSPAAAERATPVFGPPQTVATASDVGFLTELETGDVNGDGLTDAVVTRLEFQTHETFPIGVFLADGRGGFQNGDSLFAGPIPRTEHGRQIVIADFNGDRRNDIFVADHGYDAPPFPGYPNTLALSTPEGKLVESSANLPAESGFSHSAAAADIDRDGDVDIFVGNIFGGDAPPELLLNDGAGHFVRGDGRLPAAQTDRSQNKYTRSLFVDVNGDAAPDLVLGADNNTPSSTVLLNGHGAFHRGARRDAAEGIRADGHHDRPRHARCEPGWAPRPDRGLYAPGSLLHRPPASGADRERRRDLPRRDRVTPACAGRGGRMAERDPSGRSERGRPR